MLTKTRAIALHYIKYSDTSVILTAYTEAFGRVSFMLQGIRRKNSKINLNMFQPLFLSDLEVYYKQQRSLQKIKEASNAYPFQSIPYDYRKRTIALFLAEVLYKSLQEEESNPALFGFLINHIKMLDLKEKGLGNFHLYILLHLTKYLGFFPQNNYSKTFPFFDMQNGKFTSLKPVHNHFLDYPDSENLSELLKTSSRQHQELPIKKERRLQILHGLLDFYYLHNPGMGHIKSFEILKETFR
ncbi:MAG: DNA repair protein RecO [Bacteroidales bacterium]